MWNKIIYKTKIPNQIKKTIFVDETTVKMRKFISI